MPLGPFEYYGRYGGDPQGATVQNEDGTVTHVITTDSIDDKASWFAWWDAESGPDPLKPGDQLTVNYVPLPEQKGEIKVLWYVGREMITSVDITTPGQTVIVPDGIDNLRLDFRWWNQIGKAEIKALGMERLIPDQPGGGITLPPPQALPNFVQISGIAWEFGFFLVPHMDGQPISAFPPWPAPGEYMNVQGYAEDDGRIIVLTMLQAPAGEAMEGR